MRLSKNSCPKKTQIFGKTQIIFFKTQVFSPKISFLLKNHRFFGIEIKVTKSFQKTKIKIPKTELFGIFKSRAEAKVRTKKESLDLYYTSTTLHDPVMKLPLVLFSNISFKWEYDSSICIDVCQRGLQGESYQWLWPRGVLSGQKYPSSD